MHYDHVGRLLLRLTLGLLMLPHGISKLMGGAQGLSGLMRAYGLPESVAYLSIVGEFIAPVLIIIGIYTRPAAWMLALHMVVALALAHNSHLFQMGDTGGLSIELQLFFLLIGVVVALMGAGRYSLGGSQGRYN